MSYTKEEPRYNIISVRVNAEELSAINKICDDKNISASKACRLLMFGVKHEHVKDPCHP